MGPSVDGNARDIASRIETAQPEYAGQLISNTSFIGFECSRQQVAFAGRELFVCAQSGLAGNPREVQHDGFFR